VETSAENKKMIFARTYIEIDRGKRRHKQKRTQNRKATVMNNTGGKVNCNHLTNKSMNFSKSSLLIAIMSFALIILPALAGCDWVQDREIFYGTEETTEQSQQTTSQTQGPTPVADGGEVETQTRADVKNVRYELAEGWHWDNLAKTIAIKGPEYGKEEMNRLRLMPRRPMKLTNRAVQIQLSIA
jgi:hypothetical protein